MQPAILRQRSILALIILLSGTTTWADANNNDSPQTTEVSVGSGDSRDKTWADKSHSYVTNRADELAQWMDHFFGVSRSDIEAAHSSLRLQLGYDWDEKDHKSRVRLRGKLYLPRISERISLVFTDENNETDDNEDIESIARDVDNDNSVALEYKARDKNNARLDFRLGLRNITKLKASARYRYLHPLSDKYLTRFTEEIYFQDGEGFGSLTRVDLDRIINNDHLVRWSNRFEYSEETPGVEWGTKLSSRHRIGDKAAVSYFLFSNGETRPQKNTGYGLGFSYRRNIHREWLFFEVEPSYGWRREAFENNREGIAAIDFRLEVLLQGQIK